jgi:GNAT superfamily N-acetyltransferase
MIRPTTPEETSTLVALAEETGVFKPFEIVALREVLDDYHAFEHKHGHRAVTYFENDQPIGFAYYAPADMADRTWYLYWIAVSKKIQAKGVGGQLMKYAEDDIRSVNGRVLFIDTSGLPHYDLTRKFYFKQGYELGATLKDFYADGDDLVVFRKRLQPPSKTEH